MRKAVQKVQQNVNRRGSPYFQEVADEFKLPKTTLINRYQRGLIVRGKVFTVTEEKMLVDFILQRQQGRPLTKESFLNVVNSYLSVS